MTQCYAGIDPGISGGVAFYFPAAPDRVAVYDMPVIDGRVNAVALSQLFEQFLPAGVIIEAVSARPGQGVTSMFNFGKATGTAIGVAAAHKIPMQSPTPQKWKKHYALTNDKSHSRRRAVERWPSCADQFCKVKDHNKAEAAFLALYAAEVAFKQVEPCFVEPETKKTRARIKA